MFDILNAIVLICPFVVFGVVLCFLVVFWLYEVIYNYITHDTDIKEDTFIKLLFERYKSDSRYYEYDLPWYGKTDGDLGDIFLLSCIIVLCIWVITGVVALFLVSPLLMVIVLGALAFIQMARYIFSIHLKVKSLGK